jgi:L-alanine-DL-glutamate epimerase-like enolase superfamily enzyme
MREFPVTDCIQFARRVEDYHVAYLEDLQPDDQLADWAAITEKTTVPTLVGEDLYLLDSFRDLVSEGAIRIAGPDILSAGGIGAVHRIGHFADQFDVDVSLHYAGSPVGFAASVHAAATLPNVIATEFHGIGLPWWGDVIQGEIFTEGKAPVPTEPGLGIELDMDTIERHVKTDAGFFQ